MKPFLPDRVIGAPRRIVSAASLQLLLTLLFVGAASAQMEVDLSQYRNDSEISVVASNRNMLEVSWPTSKNTKAQMVFDLRNGQPLIESIKLKVKDESAKVLATRLEPVTTLTIGERDKKKFEEAFQGMVFFENPRQKPYETHLVTLTKEKVRVSSNNSRVTISIGHVSAGSFSGDLRFTFYCNSPLVHAETVVSTHETLRAILYDTGLSSASPDWNRMVWLGPLGKLRSETINSNAPARPLGVKQRTIVAEGNNGSIAIFPAPHQYFYPLDFADNFQFNWFGNSYRKMPAGFGFGIRQPPEGDKRWVPWFDAPAKKEHHLGVFYLFSPGDGEQTLNEVARYTHGDR